MMTDMTLPPSTDDAAGSGDVAAENLARLKALFPQIVRDGRIDVEILRQLVGEAVETGEERYGLNWKGKAAARAHALTPSLGTLRPAKADSVDWDTTQNIMIEGENTEVLKVLRKSYAGRVKMIYIDPPYNTGRNLIYKNDYSSPLKTYLEDLRVSDGEKLLVSNTRDGGAFHTNWLNSIYPVLAISRELLTDDGVFVLTIDENEFSNVSILLKEIFGEGEFEHSIASIVHNPRGQQGKNFSYVNEYAIFIYRDDGKKYLADVAKKEIDSRNLRDSGTESDRSDARNCFYPILVKDGAVVGFGEVPADDFHPKNINVLRDDGVIEVWPLAENGDEKKWRYARQTVVGILDKLSVKAGRTSLQIIFNKDSGTVRSVWQDARFDSSEYGTKLIEEIIPGSGFTFPKSLFAVQECIKIATNEKKDALILDFFAGSGTTGHATMLQNVMDGGNRRFILVQLPVPLDPSDKDQKQAAKFCDNLGKPRNIAELTKERLRRAGDKLQAEYPLEETDTGFRVYKLDTSNLRPWQPDGDDLTGSLLDAVDNVLPGRSEDDLLVELMLKTGIDLAMPSETRTIAGQTVHSFGGGALMVCLGTIADAKAEELALGIAAWRAELAPAGQTAFWFKDSGFASAAAKANVAAILRQRIAASDIARIAAL